jgi:hypothetical protein
MPRRLGWAMVTTNAVFKVRLSAYARQTKFIAALA